MAIVGDTTYSNTNQYDYSNPMDPVPLDPLSDTSDPKYGPSSGNGSLDQLYELAKTNPEYMETYLKLLAERENTTQAQAWYERMSSSSYQRAVEDLKKAGLNPALAIANLSGAGAGNVAPAGTWNTSPYANYISKRSDDTKRISQVMQTFSVFSTAILALVAMLA